MENKRPVRCNENENVALYLWTKRQEMADRGEISDSFHLWMKTSPCIFGRSVMFLSQIFFINRSTLDVSLGKKAKAPRRYVPQKNSTAYALLIILYRGIVKGATFMNKQELRDDTEASELSLKSIRPFTLHTTHHHTSPGSHHVIISASHAALLLQNHVEVIKAPLMNSIAKRSEFADNGLHGCSNETRTLVECFIRLEKLVGFWR
ncbi:Crossover junction endonuclease MUS81 [Platanthera zijinensis]|uniref:Crossover junction endonuclease MUS81 n=1 Tax=Platanthera zijinensis TaxID=2320716 RepID=A0AAP0AVW8_9ASPA